jgi:TPR repeat protein
LGVLYEKGEGIQDYVKGYAWFNLAALQGDRGGPQKSDSVVRWRATH